MGTPYKMLQQGVVTVPGVASPDLLASPLRQYRLVLPEKTPVVRRSRSFKNLVLALLFCACLSGVSITMAVCYLLLGYIK